MTKGREAVVLVHGIWMTGIDLLVLKLRLGAAGFDPHVFRYPSLRRDPATNAAYLASFVEQVPGEVVHFVGHSLGGLVILHLFARTPPRRPGRVVLIASPVRGSAAAHAYAATRLLRPLLGRSLRGGLAGDAPRWAGDRELGTIAGTQGVGIGRLTGRVPAPNDGTVAVAETELEGAADRLLVPHSHVGVLTSRRVASAVAAFLKRGRFPIGDQFPNEKVSPNP